MNFLEKIKFTGQKNSPEILLVTGVIGVVAAGVLACRATLKAQDVKIKYLEKVSIIESTYRDVLEGNIPVEEYSEEDKKKDLRLSSIQMGIGITKLYAPAIILGAASIAAIIFSHGIMKQRQASLVAAFNVLNAGFKAYRNRVIEKLGEDEDTYFRTGLKSEETTKMVIDEQTGQEKN
jgi:hypothetical protein